MNDATGNATGNAKCSHGHDLTEDNIYINEHGETTCSTCRRFVIRQSKIRTIARRRPKEKHPGITDR